MTRSIVLRDGGVETADVPAPELGADAIRVTVTLAGINYWEVMQRNGRVPLAEPGVLGTEGVGIVSEVGANVRGLAPGLRVAWSRVPGSWAEQVTGPAASFYPVPDGVDDATAAGLLFQGATAHYLATETWPVGEGDVAVVTAAAGGVGLLLTQLLAAAGASVVGVTSTEAKRSAVLESGAAHALEYGPDLVDRIRAIAPLGAVGVFDSVGGDVARDLLPALRARGGMVLYGAASGTEAPLGPKDLVAGSYFLTRAAGKDYTRDPAAAAGRATQLFNGVLTGRLRVRVGERWKLDEAPEALNALEARRTVGKLLLEL